MADLIRHNGTKDQSYFEERLAVRFPAIAEALTEIERGLLHVEMGAFARATRTAIEGGNLGEFTSHLAFIDELLDGADSDLANAIYVSYLESVFLGRDDAPYCQARSALSDRLRAALAEMQEGWNKFDARNRARS
jgi:hypothetical protein